MSWELLLEDLLRGLVHTINNRVTAMSAFAELAEMGDEPSEAGLMRLEIRRLHAASSLISALASRDEQVEALEVGTVLETALSAHEHHPRARTITCAVEKASGVLPVRVHRWALLRVLLLMIDGAKRAADAARQGSTVVRITGDEAEVRVHAPVAGPLSEDAVALAGRCGGTLSIVEGAAVLVLPSLLEVRRRERATKADPSPAA
jgi:signal transduction histidine kinase